MPSDAEAPHKAYPNRTAKGRFRTGFSGNRLGRPARVRSTKSVFQAMLASKVAMRIDGKLQTISVTEAMAARVKREALTGPLRGLEKGIAVAQMYSLEDPPKREQKIDLSLLTDEELAWYGRILSRLTGLDYDATNPSFDCEPSEDHTSNEGESE